MGGVIFQVYIRSFADSNGDGIGDLPGIAAHLDYLTELGIDALWLSPVHPSPNVDWGYDVADYRAVHPDYGTLDDLDALIAAAGARGIEIWLDLVPNHTSDRHPWFGDRPEYYVWSEEIPNDWTSIFTGRDRLAVRHHAAAVLPAPVRARAARPRLVERRRCATSSTTSSASGSTAA